MTSIPKQHINEILNKLCSKLDLSDWSYSVANFEKVAQNYFGILIPVSLNGKLIGKDVTLSIVIKCAPTDERYRVSGAITQFFLKEIFTYSTILTKYSEYQSQFLSCYVSPKCYYICEEYCKETIVLQNMVNDGYMPYTQDTFVDYNHALVSLKSLAKFHALSFIMKAKDPKLYKQVASTCTPLTVTANKRFFDVLADRLEKALQQFEDIEYKHKIENLKKNYVRYVEVASNAVQNTCICHGDIWKENIMYKYKNNKPVSACIIDYQTCRESSPAYDVLYFIISSTDTQLRRKHFDQLLNIYYEEFIETLNEAHLHSQSVYPREAFDKDLESVAPACLVIVNTAMWLSHGLQEDGHVISNKIPKNASERKLAMKNYTIVIKNIIDDLCSYNYLCPCLS